MQEPSTLEKQELVAKVALQGAIGRALIQALEDLGRKESSSSALPSCDDNHSITPTTKEINENNENNEEHNNNTAEDRYKETLQHWIPKTFGKLVANTDWKSICDNGRLSARLDHYNRFHGQWRIVVSDTKLYYKRSIPPEMSKLNNAKKRRRILQKIDEDFNSSSIKIDDKIQILAFHDLS